MSTTPDSLKDALDLFNRQAFFECHEVLEDLWRPLPPGSQKQFLQGLIQVAVGFHHLQNRNYTGTKNLLLAGLEKLDAVAQQEDYHPPIVLAPLLETSHEALETVLELGPKRLDKFPKELIPTVQSSLNHP